MFEIGKRTPRKPLTPEQRQAVQEIKDYCNRTGLTRDELCRMFGIGCWRTFENLRTKGPRAEEIAKHLQAISKHAILQHALSR